MEGRYYTSLKGEKVPETPPQGQLLNGGTRLAALIQAGMGHQIVVTVPPELTKLVPHLDIRVEFVSPEVAEDYLTSNTHNRPLSRRGVATYSRDIQEGRWQFNAETISFDWDGVLINGQHRLYAVFETRIGVYCIVVRGLPPEAQSSIDINKIRTPQHILALDGVKCSKAFAAMARLVLVYDKYDKFLSATAEKEGPTPTEVAAFGKAHHEEFAPSVRVGVNCLRLTSPAVAGCCHYLFSRIDAPMAERFFDELMSGGRPNTSPTFHLRERLLANQSSGKSRLERRYILAIFFKAWNAYRQGRQMGVLRWSTDGAKPEPFPSL